MIVVLNIIKYLSSIVWYSAFQIQLGRPLSKNKNFIFNNGEAETLVTGLCRFYRRIEREEIRLFGNVVDDLDDPSNILDLRT